MHYEQARDTAVDPDRCAVGEFRYWLEQSRPDGKSRVDGTVAHYLNGMGTKDFRNSLDGFIDIPGTH
jgi:hypothetical protein